MHPLQHCFVSFYQQAKHAIYTCGKMTVAVGGTFGADFNMVFDLSPKVVDPQATGAATGALCVTCCIAGTTDCPSLVLELAQDPASESVSDFLSGPTAKSVLRPPATTAQKSRQKRTLHGQKRSPLT